MADDDQGTTEEAPSGGGKKKLILLIIIGLVLIAASVGGTLAFVSMMKGDEPEAAATEEGAEGGEAADDSSGPKAQAIYYPLKPPIIVNFEAKGRQRYLQAELTLLTREADVISAIELHMPAVRNALVLLIGGQLYEDIQTAEGKEFLRLQCLEELQNLMQKEIGKPGIEQVLFTNLVMQ